MCVFVQTEGSKEFQVCFVHTRVCNDFDVNLVDDSVKRSVETISGCVELCDDNEYLGLCNPLWDEEEATVVCQQLGYYRALGKN